MDKDKGLEATSQYDESDFPSSVNSFDNLTISIKVATAIPEIETQLRAFPDGIIAVQCPRHEELDVVCQVLSRSSLNENIQIQRHTDGYEAFDPERHVIVTTLHGAKGLEFRTAHLMGTDKIRFSSAATEDEFHRREPRQNVFGNLP